MEGVRLGVIHGGDEELASISQANRSEHSLLLILRVRIAVKNMELAFVYAAYQKDESIGPG